MKNILGIVIPVYNESDNIVNTLDSIRQKVATEHTIYIVYDFLEDTTIPAVRKYISQNNSNNIELVHNNIGRGVLNAIKMGMTTAENEIILVTMGDLSDDMIAVDSMVKKLKLGYDIICGSRYVSGGEQIGGPFIKKTLSRLAGLSLHILTGIPTHDITNSFKLYRKSILNGIKIESDGGFELGLEILVKSWVNGLRITEVPTIWKDRTNGESRFKVLQWLPKYLRWYWYAILHRFDRKTQCGLVNERPNER